MNTRKNSIAAKLAIQAAVLLACLPALSQADSGTPAPRSMQVSAAGLDLNTAAGAHAFYSRLNSAAKSVCNRNSEGDPIYGRQFSLCYGATLRSAVLTVNRPLVTQRYNEEHGAAGPATSEDASLIRMAAK